MPADLDIQMHIHNKRMSESPVAPFLAIIIKGVLVDMEKRLGCVGIGSPRHRSMVFEEVGLVLADMFVGLTIECLKAQETENLEGLREHLDQLGPIISVMLASLGIDTTKKTDQ